MRKCVESVLSMDKLNTAKSNHLESFKGAFFLFIHLGSRRNINPSANIVLFYMNTWCSCQYSVKKKPMATTTTTSAAPATVDTRQKCCMIYCFIQISKRYAFWKSYEYIIERKRDASTADPPNDIFEHSKFANFSYDWFMGDANKYEVNHFSRIFSEARSLARTLSLSLSLFRLSRTFQRLAWLGVYVCGRVFTDRSKLIAEKYELCCTPYIHNTHTHTHTLHVRIVCACVCMCVYIIWF